MTIAADFMVFFHYFHFLLSKQSYFSDESNLRAPKKIVVMVLF